MKKIIVTIFLVSCTKNINNLVHKNKVSNKYWKYIKENRAEELEQYLGKEENKSININKVENEEKEIALTLAAKYNSLDVVELLLNRKDTFVDQKNSKEQTSLIISITDGEESLERDEIIDTLLNKGADVNTIYGIDGNNVLMLSIIKEDEYTIEKILNKEVEINAQNLEGDTALILCIKSDIDKNKKIKILDLLLAKENICIDKQDNRGKTALMFSIINDISEEERDKIINLLLTNKDIDVNKQDEEGKTVLMFSIINDISKEKRDKIINLLLTNKDIDINKQDQLGGTALIHAVINNSYKLMQQLLSREDIDKDIVDKEGKGAFDHITLDEFKPKIAVELAKHNIRPRKEKEFCERGRREDLEQVIKMLIEGKGDIKYKKKGKSILDSAINLRVSDNSLRLIKYLLKAIRPKEEVFEKYLEHTKRTNSLIFKYLLFYKSKNEIMNKYYENIEKYYGKIDIKQLAIDAVFYGDKNLVKKIIDKDLEFNKIEAKKINEYRNILLMIAIEKGYNEMVKMLIESGANANEKSRYSRTALMEAVETEDKKIIELLIEGGANIDKKNKLSEMNLIMLTLGTPLKIIKLLWEKEFSDIEDPLEAKNRMLYIINILKNHYLEFFRNDIPVDIFYILINVVIDYYKNLNSESDNIKEYLELLYLFFPKERLNSILHNTNFENKLSVTLPKEIFLNIISML